MQNHSELEDYETVRNVLAHLSENWREQPSLTDLARPAGLSEDQLQK